MMPRALIGMLATGLGALLVWTMLDLPAPPGEVHALVAAHLGESGVKHDVTAVLLNFRGYDTLLEIGVLLLAVLGVLAVRLAAADTGAALPPPAGSVLRALANLLVPVMVLVAGYLLWAGAHRPGGAFQAGAVLAAAGVLLRLAGRLPALLPPRFGLRAGLLIGFALFLAVALGLGLTGGALLQYPVSHAGPLILLIEASLTVSIALILISLFVGAPSPGLTRHARSASGPDHTNSPLRLRGRGVGVREPSPSGRRDEGAGTASVPAGRGNGGKGRRGPGTASREVHE